jgi:hypothetical protein
MIPETSYDLALRLTTGEHERIGNPAQQFRIGVKYIDVFKSKRSQQ